MEESVEQKLLEQSFGGILEGMFQDDTFNSFDPSDYGLAITGALKRFSEKYEISDTSQLERIAQEKHQELRNRREIPRFQPKEDEFSLYYEPFDIDESKPVSERIGAVDDWIDKSLKKATSIRKSEKEDFEYHLRDIANDYIRREKAKEEKPGLLGDTWNRGVQAIAEPFYRIGNEKKSDRYFAEHLVEDPERDEDLFSKFVVGGGEFIPQLAIGSALMAARQPQLIAPVFGALFGARYMRGGYYEEMKRSGNKQMAMGNAFAQLPAAALDTFSEVFLLGAGKTGKAFFKEFLAASTEEAKRAVLKKAIPSVLKESGTQFLSEGLIGGAGADFASGFGSWIATGDEKYLENATNIQKLAESAFVEGTLGAGVGAGLTALGKNSEIRGVSEQIRNLTLSSKKDQQFVFDALKRKDYDSVMNFLSRNIQVKDEAEYKEAIDLLKKESGTILSKPDEPKKQNETKEEKKAREFISNSEYVINLRKRLKEIEGDEVKQDEADRLRANIKSIQEGKFTEKEEFDSEITQEEVSGYSFKGFDPSKDQSSGVFDTTLEDGNKLDDENVVFIQPNNFTNKRTFNSLELLYGASPTVIFSPNKDTAKIVLPGKGIGSQELKASTSPKKGWIPVRVTSEQKDGGYKTKVSFLPKVKEYNKLKLDPKKYQVINRDDNSITIRNEGRDYKLTGNAANYIASQQEAVNNRELDKFLEKNSDRLELVYKLWEKASNNKWTEQEKNDFIANVDGAIDTLENLSKLDNDDTFIEIAMKLLDAKASLSKINVSKTNNEISLIETKEEDIGEETEETIEQETKEDTKTKKKSPHKLSLDDTLDTAENRGVYYDGKQGKIINENGDYLFVSNSGITYDLGTQRGDISLKDAGVSIRLSNKITKTKISKPQKPVVKKEETNKQTQEQEPKAKEPEVQDQQIQEPEAKEPEVQDQQIQEPEAKEPEVQDQQIQEPQIRIAFVNYALKLARSEDNRLSGDYFINNKFTKDELNYIGKEAGVDVDGKSEYEIADEINTKLGKTRDRLDRKKDNEFKKTGDKLNPNSIRKSKSSIGSTEKRDIKRRIIDRLKNSIGFNKVIVVNTQEELPNNVKIDENEKVEGFADSSGNVYIVLDNIEDSQQEVERVFVHEVFGHLGVAETLRGMSLKGYLSLKSKIESYRNGDLWKSIQKKYEGDTESVWVDESIAHIFNDRRPEARSIVRAILDKIRIALVKAGIKKWSNNDIEALIRETFSKRKFDKGVSIVGASNVSFSKADKISSRDIANHSIISHYGAWIDKSGNLFLIDGESNDFPHYEKALEILEIKDDNNITDVYEQMYKKGYVSIRKNQGDGYVEAGTGRNLTISQKATLENIGINDEIRIILDNGVSGTKTIYSPPTANDLARFSKKQENGRIYDISNVSNKNIRFSKADLLKLPDEALSKTGKEFATVVDNMRRADGSTFIKKETKTPEQLNEIAKEIIKTARDNPEYFTVKIDPRSLSYTHMYRNADGPIDMDDPVENITASVEARMLWDLEKNGGIEEYKKKEAEELTKMRSSILSDNAYYLFENENYSNFESAQMLIALSKIAVKDLPNNEYRSVEISKNNRQMPMQLDGEYASYVRDELRAGKIAKEAIKSGYKKTQESSKEDNKNIKDGWIKINKSDSAEEASKLAKLCAGTGWCVSNDNTASSYLKRGDFYVYFKDGKIQIGIGYSWKSLEIRGTFPGQLLSEQNEKIAEDKIIGDKIEKGEDFLNDRKIIKDIYDVLKNKAEVTDEFISSVVSLYQNKEISSSFNKKTIDDKIKELNSVFSIYIYPKLKTLSLDKKIIDLLEQKIEGLNYNKFFSVGENGGIVSSVDISSKEISISIFEKIEGSFTARNLTEAPLLKEVNGNFYAPNLTEAPLLEKVEGSFDAPNLTEAPLLEKVKGSFYAQNLTEAPLLKEVNGNFYAPNLTEAPLLEKVNGYFDAPNLTEAPLLKEVNGNFYAQNLTEAPLLEKVEGSFDAPNLTEDNVRFSKHGSVQELNYFDDSLFNDFVFITKDKIAKRREISRLKGTKLEASLIIDEKQAHDALKSINPLYLNEEHLERYSSILSNFVNTRSKVDSPPLSRESIQSILSSLSEITNHQNEQIYDKYSREFPDIEGINFRKEDETIDIEKLQDWVSSRIEIDDVLESPRLIGEDHAQYIEAVAMLQEQLSEEINDPDSIIYSMVNKEEGIIDTGNPLLDKGNNIIRERLNDIKQHLNDFVSQLLQFDPIEATFKETRVNYYSLMSILGDGYPLKSGSFISARTKRILESEGNKFVNPYSEKQTESWLDKAMSFGTKIRRIAGNDNSLKALYDLVAPFREGIFNAQRWTTEVARPYLDNALSEAEKIQGRHFNDIDRIKMGIYALLRRHHITEKPEDGLKRNIEWIKKSIDNYKNSYDKGLAESASRQESIIDLLTNGIDFDSEYAMLELENNAKAILGDGAVKLVSDIVVLFDTLKPLSRVSTEVVYGRPFAEVVNYIPSMQMIIKGSHSELDMSDISMSADNISIANGSVGSNDIINTKGMSTTKDWLRKIGTNRALALDVMLLADNVGRLAALDYFTSFERREIHNMMISNTKISKKLAEFLGDKNDDLGRTSLFNNATRTMWQNELENHTFVAPIQGIANKFVNWWARGRLSGIHQLFSQTPSNYAPFFVANINNPRKIARSFEAFGLMLKYNAGLTTEAQNKVIEKITYEIKHRAQDTFLDKSANLNIKGSEFKSWFKGTGFYHAIRETDDVLEKILFAPFKWSDYISGTPILLAEYLDNEIQRTGVTSMSFDDMVYNMESHHRAVDETERFIGIGNGSRRAEWFHNRDGLIAFSRNLLTAFSSHRINNATNFNSELRRLTEHDLSPEEKAKSLRYMAGIAAQTVVFGGVKFLIQEFIAKAIVNAIRSDDDDDLEELYLEREGMSKEEKAIINTEISFRRQVRSQISKLKDRTENYEGLAVSLAKDGIINMFIIPSFGEMAVDAIIHLGYDNFQKENFKEFKEEEIKRLKKLYKEEKGDGQETEVSARIAEDISDLESQVYFPVTFETRTVAPLGGSFGGVMRGLEDAAETSINNFIRMKPVSTKDILNYLSIIGVAQPDITKLVNELDKIEKLKEEQSKKLEKIEEEDEETNVFSF